MAKKIYEAPNTIISNVTIFVGGKPRRISFTPISEYEGSHTGKGSMLTTDNVELQEALESSPMFNRIFRLWRVEAEPVKAAQTTDESDNGTDEEASRTVVGINEVATLNDARDYLESHFGIEKSKLPTTKAITNAAAKAGILFEFIK